MTSGPFTPPAYQLTAFNCPHCYAMTEQLWGESSRAVVSKSRAWRGVDGVEFTWCAHCGATTIWRNGKLIDPAPSLGEQPNPDLDADAQDDFREAASIVHQSPRGAAALLRLAIQKICIQLGEQGKNINDDIASLVGNGTIPPLVQKSLDVVRVVGNNAVHPGELDLRDDFTTAVELFKLVNLIATIAISQPKAVADLYASLPEGARTAIEKRDEEK